MGTNPDRLHIPRIAYEIRYTECILSDTAICMPKWLVAFSPYGGHISPHGRPARPPLPATCARRQLRRRWSAAWRPLCRVDGRTPTRISARRTAAASPYGGHLPRTAAAGAVHYALAATGPPPIPHTAQHTATGPLPPTASARRPTHTQRTGRSAGLCGAGRPLPKRQPKPPKWQLPKWQTTTSVSVAIHRRTKSNTPQNPPRRPPRPHFACRRMRNTTLLYAIRYKYPQKPPKSRLARRLLHIPSNQKRHAYGNQTESMAGQRQNRRRIH
jgi:hypothetical protein